MAYIKFTIIAGAVISALSLQGCADEVDTSIIKPNSENQQVIRSESEQRYVDAWKSEFQECAADITESAETLNLTADEFLDKPVNDNFKKAYQSWQLLESNYQNCYDYLMTIDDFKSQQAVLSRLAYWPMVAGYIDTTQLFGKTGIVNDLTLEINPETLIEQHQRYGDEQISLGLYVIGLFLGYESDRKTEDFQFVPSDDDKAMTLQLSEIRRRDYLKTAVQQWQADWQTVVSFVEGLKGNDDLKLKQRLKRSLQVFLQGETQSINEFKDFSILAYHQQLLRWMEKPEIVQVQVQAGADIDVPTLAFSLRGFWPLFDNEALLKQFSDTVSEEKPFGDDDLRNELYQALFYPENLQSL